MTIWYLYDRQTGEPGGSGITRIDNERWESRTDPPPTGWETEQALRTVARRTVIADLNTLPDATITEVAALFDLWRPGLTHTQGEVRRWDSTLIRCLQAHTNHDPNHTPDVTPALWTIYRPAPSGGNHPLWVKPGSTNPYNATWDDGTGPVVVRHNGLLWENTHGDGNVWEPSVFGWAPYTP